MERIYSWNRGRLSQIPAMASFDAATCPQRAKRFRVIWRTHESRLLPSIVIKLTCPLCRYKFDQVADDMLISAARERRFAQVWNFLTPS